MGFWAGYVSGASSTGAGQEQTRLGLYAFSAPKSGHAQLFCPKMYPSQGGREAATLTWAHVGTDKLYMSTFGAENACNPSLVGS